MKKIFEYSVKNGYNGGFFYSYIYFFLNKRYCMYTG